MDDDDDDVKPEVTTATPLVRLTASPLGPKCPFGKPIEFTLRPGGCVCLKGPSGRGKTTLASVLYENDTAKAKFLSHTLDMEVAVRWNDDVPLRERCGVLFQQTTLLDELTVAGNLTVALQQQPNPPADVEVVVRQLLEAVGLDYDRDASKRPTQLSGGMGRRVCLALQLAQHKRVVVLDEPFTGLDYDAAVSVAKELVRIRREQHTALVLISHEPHLTKLVLDPDTTSHNQVVELIAPLRSASSLSSLDGKFPNHQSMCFGTRFQDRFLERLMDYILYSLPLIALAFVACGLAISMLTADLLQRLEISGKVLGLVEKEVKPLIKMLTGEDASMLQMMAIRMKVTGMLNQTVPPAKASLYAIGLTKLFVLEVGPLLTALLLCGRIGGSYAGKVGTMQATNQNKLLRTLGINPHWWTLWPSLLAALLASPLLTMVGTFLALYLAGWVGPVYGIGERVTFWTELNDALFPVLRLRSFEPFWNLPCSNEANSNSSNFWTCAASGTKSMLLALRRLVSDPTHMDLTVTYKIDGTWKDSTIEIATYPPVYHLLKAKVFIIIIVGVAECVARSRPNLTPRGVPSVITMSVVVSGLLVILADWGFSQLWLLRK
ncbi:ABC transporter-like protein [Nitzschia inconspicua]|uniref:ABC transporter-like protein n=1 Tax=Nitzschia inconspicua TaxID=303405 RepID=A0A9K3Q7T3_9STRA|nr:ABC transporter-like protein [Nitzschia inconspicua]